MVAGGQAHQPLAAGQAVILLIGIHKSPGIALAFPAEEGMVAAEQVHIVGIAEVQKEIHVETAHEGFVRLAPLGQHHRVGILFVHEPAHLLPQLDGFLAVGVIFHQRSRHVDAEAVTAAAQPEIHHVHHGLPGGQCFGGIHRALPGLGGVGKAVVQRRLVGEEVHRHAAVPVVQPPQRTGDVAVPGHIVPDGIAPDVPSGILVFLNLAGFSEPGVPDGSVPRHQIQDHVHVPAVGFLKQTDQVVIGAVAGGDPAVVLHVIACIPEGGQETGVQPQSVAAQLPDVVQFFHNAGQITDAVAVGVQKTLRVDLIEDTFFQPVFHNQAFLLAVMGPPLGRGPFWLHYSAFCPGGKAPAA